MDNKLNRDLIAKATKELVKFVRKESEAKSSLIDDLSSPISVQLQLIKGINEEVMRPVRVKIPNTMYNTNEEEHSVCMFCRSEDKEAIEAFFRANPFDGLTTIISLNEVKKQYKAFKDRKELLNNHSHFVCDIGIVSHLYNLLGKVFSQRNNYPIPVKVDGCFKGNTKLLANVLQAVDSAYMHLHGSHINIRLGNTGMPVSDVADNVYEGVHFAVDGKIKDSWKNIHSVHIKTPTSASLPLYYRNSKEMTQVLAASVAAASSSKKVTALAATPVASAVKPKKAAKTPVAAPEPAATPVASAVKPKKAAKTPVAAPEPVATPVASAVKPKKAAKTPVAAPEPAATPKSSKKRSAAPVEEVKETPKRTRTTRSTK